MGVFLCQNKIKRDEPRQKTTRCSLDSRSLTLSCPRRFWGAAPKSEELQVGWMLPPAKVPPAWPRGPSAAPGARDGLETPAAAAALEGKQINLVPRSQAELPLSLWCFWGEPHPQHGVFGSLPSNTQLSQLTAEMGPS